MNRRGVAAYRDYVRGGGLTNRSEISRFSMG